MGTQRRNAERQLGIADVLFPRVAQRVLALLFGQPDRRFQSAELIRLTASGTGAAHRFITDLARSGLVSVTAIGNQKHYQANRASPIFADLSGLVIRTVGLVDPLRSALRRLAPKIEQAFVYGSFASRSETAASDVDLLVVSDDLEYAELFDALGPAESLLGRKINPRLVTRTDWSRKLRDPDSFASRVATAERIDIIAPARVDP